VGPPISSAMRRASSAEVAKPCGETGMPASATILRDSYSKNLMGGGSLSWAAVRLAIYLFLVLLFPAAAAAADLSLGLDSPEVRFGTGHRARGRLVEGTSRLAGQRIELQGRPYPYTRAFKTLARTTTDANGAFAFSKKFDRNIQLQAVAPAVNAKSDVVRAYVFPRPRSVFKALSGGRLRITQFLRTPAGVRLTAATNFYLGPRGATTARRVARAKPRRIGSGRFRARATVRLPRSWEGEFRYASCFRYSGGSGMGNPRASCPKRWRFR
jgi:hypothetical protein